MQRNDATLPCLPSTHSMEGVLMTLPLKMASFTSPGFLLSLKILGRGRSGWNVLRRSMARGLQANTNKRARTHTHNQLVCNDKGGSKGLRGWMLV